MRASSTSAARPSDDEFAREALAHLQSLYRTARRLTGNDRDAEDLVQETMLRAWRFFHQYEPGTNCRAWLMRILHNAWFNHAGRLARAPATTSLDGAAEHEVYGRLADDAAGQEDNPEAVVLRDIWDEQVVKAIDALPVEYRTVVVLVDVEELSYKDVAATLDIPIGTVRSRLARGRRALAARLSRV